MTKIWGDGDAVNNAAVPLAQIRALRNISIPSKHGSSPSGEASNKEGFEEVTIPSSAANAPKTYYMLGSRYYVKTATTVGESMRGSDVKTPPMLAWKNHPFAQESTGTATPTVYANDLYFPKLHYLGNGRFVSQADSGCHFSQLYMPNGSLAANSASGTNGFAYDYVQSVGCAYIGVEADPSTPAYSDFFSSLSYSFTKLVNHTRAETLLATFGLKVFKPHCLGAYDFQSTVVTRVAPVGVKTDGTAGFVTVISNDTTATPVNGLPNTASAALVVSDDGVTMNSAYLTTTEVFDTASIKYIGPVVSTGPGKAICVVASGLPAPRYILEEVRTYPDTSVDLYYLIANAYGVAELDVGSYMTTAFGYAGFDVPNVANDTPDRIVQLRIKATSNWGASWTNTTLDPAAFFPDDLPYSKIDTTYHYSAWASQVRADPSSATLAKTVRERITEEVAVRSNVGHALDTVLNMFERTSEMCVIDEDIVLWYYSFWKTTEVTTGDSTVPDTGYTGTNYVIPTLMKSEDGGFSWARVTDFPDEATDFFGGSLGTSDDADYGVPWRGEMKVEMECLRTGVVMAKVTKWDMGVPSTVYAYTAPYPLKATFKRPVKFYLSNDAGETWSECGCTGLPAEALSYNGATGKLKTVKATVDKSAVVIPVAVAATNRVRLYVTFDDGATWRGGASVTVQSCDVDNTLFNYLSVDDMSYVTPDHMLNLHDECYGFQELFEASFPEVHHVGEKCTADADIALPWRLNAARTP